MSYGRVVIYLVARRWKLSSVWALEKSRQVRGDAKRCALLAHRSVTLPANANMKVVAVTLERAAAPVVAAPVVEEKRKD